MEDISALISGIAAGERVDDAREFMRKIFAEQDQAAAKYRRAITAEYEAWLKSGSASVLQEGIDGLLRAERINNELRSDTEKSITPGLRDVAKHRPAALPVANELNQGVLSRIDEMSEFIRDARWRLMQRRTELLPSRGKGPIHGEPTDLDEYLKTI